MVLVWAAAMLARLHRLCYSNGNLHVSPETGTAVSLTNAPLRADSLNAQTEKIYRRTREGN